MSLRNTLRRAAGLLVELSPEQEPAEVETPTPEDEASRAQAMGEVQKVYKAFDPVPVAPPRKTVEQIVQDAPGPNLDQIKVEPAAMPAIVQEDNTVNFGAIYQGSGLPAVPFTAEQVLQLVQSLPAELPMETKRQMVNVSISAMGKSIGANPENIVADASRKLAALSAFTDHIAQDTGEFVSNAEKEIGLLQAKIEERKKQIESAQHKQTTVTQSCKTEADRLDDILEFFSLDVAPSKYAGEANK